MWMRAVLAKTLCRRRMGTVCLLRPTGCTAAASGLTLHRDAYCVLLARETDAPLMGCLHSVAGTNNRPPSRIASAQPTGILPPIKTTL